MLRDSLKKIEPHLLSLIILSGATIGLYWQALGHGFLESWDDDRYVTLNMAIRGLTWENIRTVFTSFYVGNYAPMQMMSYMLDNAVWGMQPAGFIATNILLHAANGIFFYALLLRLSWTRVAAAAAALIFLVHPVQVESVAWISERKNVLSMLFFLLSFYSYIVYRERDGKKKLIAYGSSVLSCILALMTKSVTVIIPLVFLAFDLCSPAREGRKARILDKVPFFAAAFIIVLVTLRSQAAEMGGGMRAYHGGSLFATMLTMLPVFAQYVRLIVWPMNLSAVYAPSIKTAVDLEVIQGGLALVLMLSLGGILYFRRRRDLLFWLLLFFLGLLPVSQVIPITTLMNDRYLYFPLLGAAAVIAAAAFPVRNQTGKSPIALRIAAAAVLSIVIGHYLVATYDRIPAWKNDNALWEDAVKKVPGSPKAHFQYAQVLEDEGRYDAAIGHYEAGLNLSPSSSFERYSLARLCEKAGQNRKAEQEYQAVLERSPGFLDARNALALLYINEGKTEDAAEQYQLGLQYKPDWAKAYNNLGVIYSESGQKGKALENYRKAVSLNPQDAMFHYNLGAALLDQGMPANALAEFERAVFLDPANSLYREKLSEVSGRIKKNQAK